MLGSPLAQLLYCPAIFPLSCPFWVLIKVPFSGPASTLQYPSCAASESANQILDWGTLLNIKASSSVEVIVTKYPVCPLNDVEAAVDLALVYVAVVEIGR